MPSRTPENNARCHQTTLLNAVRSKLGLKSDAALAKLIDIAPANLSHMRKGRISLGPVILIRLHEASGMSIAEMRKLLLELPSSPSKKRVVEHTGITKRGTIEQMQRIAQERGGMCLSPTYENATKKLLWQCAQQHQWEAVPYSVKAGSWCRACVNESNTRYSIPFLQEHADRRGGRVLSPRYKCADQALEWQCAAGHTWFAQARTVMAGTWCKQCASDRLRGTLERAQQLAINKGGVCLSTSYSSCDKTLKWRCASGHTWKARPGNVRIGWCPHCAFEPYRLGIEKMREIARERSGQCLSESYKNAHTHLRWQCSDGHEWNATPHSVKSGTWCWVCYQLARQKRENVKPAQRIKSDPPLRPPTSASWKKK